MGVDFYACNNCCDTFPDCGHYVSCECGERWCSNECAEAEGYRYTTREDEEGGEEYDEVSCNFCRKEDFSDSELLDFLIRSHNTSRSKVIEIYKEWKLNEGDES